MQTERKLQWNKFIVQSEYVYKRLLPKGERLQVETQYGSNLFPPLPQIVFVVIGLTTVVWSGIFKKWSFGNLGGSSNLCQSREKSQNLTGFEQKHSII